MLRHIVMVRFGDKKKAEQHAKEFEDKLLALLGRIPELKQMEVGLNVNTKPSAYDLVLIADFENDTDFNTYRIHPEHLMVVEFMRTVVSETAVVDYYI